jgi:hypothetical protein
MAETVPPNRAALGRGATGAALVVVESVWAWAGRAANATAVRRTSDSFVIDSHIFLCFCTFKVYEDFMGDNKGRRLRQALFCMGFHPMLSAPLSP